MTSPDEVDVSEMEQIFAPEAGWMPEDFGQITVAPIPYTTNPWVRPDPHIQIQPDGWMFIEVGGTRIAIPDREEWDKFTSMGDRLWNTHERAMALAQQAPGLDEAPPQEEITDAPDSPPSV